MLGMGGDAYQLFMAQKEVERPPVPEQRGHVAEVCDERRWRLERRRQRRLAGRQGALARCLHTRRLLLRIVELVLTSVC